MVVVDSARIDSQDELLLNRWHDPTVRIRVTVCRVINVLVHDHCYWILANVIGSASCKSRNVRENITVLIGT